MKIYIGEIRLIIGVILYEITNHKKTNEEEKRNLKFIDIFNNAPISVDEKLRNAGLFIKRQDLTRLLALNELYHKILNIHGSICEFGVRYGQTIAYFTNLRGIYEPFNYTRKIIGFDTFEGFPSIDEKDGTEEHATVGNLKLQENYMEYLQSIIDLHEKESPISHIKKYELIKGDAIKTVKEYFKLNPETIIAFAFFDFDLYKPTKIVLQHCKERLIKGAVVAFDELNHPGWPGETIAVMEELGLNNIELKRFTYCPNISYFIVK